MSQQRARKVGGPETVRGRAMGKAAGDSGQTGQPKQHSHASRSAKIPKSLRYDLENALVSLCDVWFSEIKPHLVRNNIKVHVEAGGGPASGDHERLPPGAPGCSHLDPGAAPDLYQRACANYAGCSSTQLTALRARCRRQQALRPPLCPPPSPPPKRSCPPIPCRTYEAKQRRAPQQPRSPRVARAPSAQRPPGEWRTPRLCRTYSVLAANSQKPPGRRTHTANPQYLHNQPKRKPKKVNKSTQTRSHHRTECSTARQPDTGRSSRPDAPDKCPRCPATTVLAHRTRPQAIPTSPLFKDDLIDIIAEKNDKQLKLLFKSPPREHSTASTMNLVSSLPPPCRAPSSRRMPWR